MEQRLKITNLTCPSCAKVCRLILGKMAGVASVVINETTGATQLEVATPINTAEIRRHLAAKGYQME